MSKSRGNVIYADDLVKDFGVDAVRYYLLSEMPHAQDGSITYESLIERYNSDLANTIGNLVNRTVAMQNKYFDGVIAAPADREPLDDEISSLALKTVAEVDRCFDEYKISDATENILTLALISISTRLRPGHSQRTRAKRADSARCFIICLRVFVFLRCS